MIDVGLVMDYAFTHIGEDYLATILVIALVCILLWIADFLIKGKNGVKMLQLYFFLFCIIYSMTWISKEL